MLKQIYLEGKAYLREYSQYNKTIVEVCKYIFQFSLFGVIFTALNIFRVSTQYINVFYLWFIFILAVSGVDVQNYLRMLNAKQAKYLNCYPIGFIKGVLLKLLKCSFYFLFKNTQSNIICCMAYFFVYKTFDAGKIFVISELVMLVSLEIILLNCIWKQCENLTLFSIIIRQIINYMILGYLFQTNIEIKQIKLIIEVFKRQNIFNLKLFFFLIGLVIVTFIGILQVLKSFEKKIYKKEEKEKNHIKLEFQRITYLHKELLYVLREKRNRQNLLIVYFSGVLCIMFCFWLLLHEGTRTLNEAIVIISLINWMEQSVSVLINSLSIDREKLSVLQYLLVGNKICYLLKSKVKIYIILLMPFVIIYVIIMNIGWRVNLLIGFNMLLYYGAMIIMNIYYLARNSTFECEEERPINIRLKGYKLIHSVIYMINIILILTFEKYVFVACIINSIFIVVYGSFLGQERKAYFGEYKKAF